MKPSAKSLGAELRKLREARQLSSVELGKLIALTAQHVKRIEAGEGIPGEPVLRRIADALQVPVDPLLALRQAAADQRERERADKRVRDAARASEELPDSPLLQFGHYLGRLRRLQGWTGKELSRRSTVSETYLAEMEKGGIYPPDERLELIASALEADIGPLRELRDRGRKARAEQTEARRLRREAMQGATP